MAEMVIRQRRKRQDRWMHTARRRLSPEMARQAFRAAMQASPGFLLAYADVLGIPSGLHLAYLVALVAADRQVKWPCIGCVAAFLMRLIWGLPLRLELLAALLLVPVAPMVVCGRGTAVMMGFAAALLLPTAVLGMLGATAAGAILSLAAVPLCALSAPVMYIAIRALHGGRAIDSMEERVSVGCLAALLICGGTRMLLGVNIGVTCAAALTLLMALYLGVGPGCIAGLMSGMMLTLQGLPLPLSVALALGGFLAGMIQPLSRRFLTCAAFAMGSLMTLIVMGCTGVACMASLLCAAVAVAVLPRTAYERGQRFFRRFLTDHPAPGDAYAALTLAAWEKTVDAMAMAVPSPMDTETERTPDWWEQKLCEGCPDRERCGSMTSDLGVRKAELVWSCRHSAQEVWLGALEELRGLGCQRLYHLRQSMDDLRREDASAQLMIRRACDQRDMLVTHLTAMAGAARRFALLSRGENWWDDMSAKRIRRALAESATPARLSYVRRVQGHAQAAFELSCITGARKQAEDLCNLAAAVLDVPMAVADVDGDRVRLAEQPLLTADVGVASAAVRQDLPCGDTAWTGLLQDGRCLVALSDGMGHGEQAALCSQQTVELLRLCLDAGYTRRQTLTAVNGMMLLAGQGERFATVDLLTVDLWSGHASIDKLGAAASWLMQEGHLTQLTGDALPLGIIENVESTADQMQLRQGDALVLLTDGTEEAFASRAALEDAIWQALSEDSASSAAASLLATASEGDAPRRDDQTVVVLRIQNARTERNIAP